MANLQCYTSKAVLDDTFKWKLKRPNNTMDMLSETGPNYIITNVRTSDEGSYSCTFNTTTNQGVPGDNTLCLITLGIQPFLFSFSFLYIPLFCFLSFLLQVSVDGLEVKHFFFLFSPSCSQFLY